MEDKKIDDLLAKYESGKASEQELRLLEKEADNLYNKSEATVFLSDLEKHQIKNELEKRISISKSNTGFGWGRIAASIAVIIGLAVGFYSSQDQLFGPEMVVAETSFGEQKTVTLPDGSTVLLNSKSTLTYPIEFSENARQVSIEGEGLFSVTKNANKPFTAMANSVKTTVLGTQFNVNAYSEDSVIAVSLLEGSVMINQAENELLLVPNEQATFSLKEKTFEKSEFDSNEIMAWQANKIVLKNTNFNSIKNLIQREYGVNIEFEQPEIGEFKISGTFDDPELKTLIATICAVKSLEFKNTDNHSILISKQ